MNSITKQFQDSPDSRFSRKALDFYDGQQLTYTVSQLDHQRPAWREKHMVPMYRNITASIINKSSMLYQSGLPSFEIMSGATLQETATAEFNSFLQDKLFIEFMKNFDVVLRLLKSAMILTQVNSETKEIMLSVLHAGNTLIKYDCLNKTIKEATVNVGEDKDYIYYRVYTDTAITDYKEHKESETLTKIGSQSNPYGVIPITPFYDTHQPRSGFWVIAEQDLVGMNEALNLNMVDSNYAAAWAVHSTLFTSVPILGAGEEPGGDFPYDDKFGRGSTPNTITENTVIGGLGKVVTIDATGADNVVFEYKSPDIDLQAGNELFMTWIKNVGQDYSVTIKSEGSLNSSISGFSLVVSEKDNVEVRIARQQQQSIGLTRFYQIYKAVLGMRDDTTMKVIFSVPRLPADENNSEKLWTEKVNEGRASIIDYLMDKWAITRTEALIMGERIKQDNFDYQIINTETEEEVGMGEQDPDNTTEIITGN